MGHCESDILDGPLSLVSSVLRICNPLIERIPVDQVHGQQESFHSQVNYSLFSQFYAALMYWLSILILPRKAIKPTEQRLNRFLWKGPDENQR